MPRLHALVVGEIAPELVLSATVPVNEVTTVLSTARAVIVTLNAVPECWVPMTANVK